MNIHTNLTLIGFNSFIIYSTHPPWGGVESEAIMENDTTRSED